MKFVLCFFVLTFLQFSSQDELYTFDPESRQIVLNEGESYLVSFHKIINVTSFGHCYITSDSINIDYPIFLNDSKKPDTRGFSPFEGIDCGFFYSEVDDETPLKWVITAYDNITERNYTEEVTVTFYYNMPLYLDRWEALETSTAVNFYLAGNTQLTKCTLTFDNTSLDLDLNKIQACQEGKFKSRLYSLGGGKCGYKINDLIQEDSTDLTLFATDKNNKIYRNTSQLIVLKTDQLINRTTEVNLGNSAKVVCGQEFESSAMFFQKFCNLYNPQGDLVLRDEVCEYNLDIVTVEDLGVWKCSAGFDRITETLDFTSELIEKKIEFVQAFTQNTTDYFIIGCKFVHFEYHVLDYCKFTRPDGKMFKVGIGSATENYNSFSTDLVNGVCALEILKPLRSEELGSWKCEGSLGLGKFGGTFIDVETAKAVKSLSNGITNKNVRLGHSFFIDCEIPYSSKKCFIIAPNGTQYKPDTELTITTGLCLFKVDVSTPTDNGEWKCSIAQTNGVPDKIITIKVSIIELAVFYHDVEVGENEEVNLICNTNDVPIDYCRFVSPSGDYYSLDQDAATSNGISYVGRGLIYGDCGMKISKVKLPQSGEWSCHISPGRNSYAKEDLTKTMKVTVKPPSSDISLAEALGIALGVVAVCIAIGGVFFYRNSERFCRRRINEENTARVSNDSSGRESIVLSVAQGAMYNT